MGSCCAKDGTKTKDANLARKDMQGLNKLPVFTVIKAQALIRGFLARRKVKRVYGF
jgi:hypothetical protein